MYFLKSEKKLDNHVHVVVQHACRLHELDVVTIFVVGIPQQLPWQRRLQYKLTPLRVTFVLYIKEKKEGI
jgi:hypothetical protein